MKQRIFTNIFAYPQHSRAKYHYWLLLRCWSISLFRAYYAAKYEFWCTKDEKVGKLPIPPCNHAMSVCYEEAKTVIHRSIEASVCSIWVSYAGQQMGGACAHPHTRQVIELNNVLSHCQVHFGGFCCSTIKHSKTAKYAFDVSGRAGNSRMEKRFVGSGSKRPEFFLRILAQSKQNNFFVHVCHPFGRRATAAASKQQAAKVKFQSQAQQHIAEQSSTDTMESSEGLREDLIIQSWCQQVLPPPPPASRAHVMHAGAWE